MSVEEELNPLAREIINLCIEAYRTRSLGFIMDDDYYITHTHSTILNELGAIVAKCNDLRIVRTCINKILNSTLSNDDKQMFFRYLVSYAMKNYNWQPSKILQMVPDEYVDSKRIIKNVLNPRSMCDLSFITRALELDTNHEVDKAKRKKLFKTAYENKRDDIVGYGLSRKYITIDDINSWHTKNFEDCEEEC